MFDRLPTPFGLVRAGVAPDHPKIKSVIRVYEKTAAREGFQFFGNVDIGARRHRRRARGALPRGRLGLRDGDRPPARDPGRGPARLARGHRVRQLVQRPPRLRRPRLRPDGQARGRDRQRQRRRRRRPHARPAPRGAQHHRHGEPRDRAARRAPGSRRSSSSAAAAPPRRRSPTPRCASSASSPTPTSSSTRPRSSSTRPAAPTSTPRTASPTHRRNVEIFTDFAQPPAGGQAQAGGDALLLLAGRDPRRGQGREHRDRPQRALRGRVRARSAPATPASATRSSAGSCCARSATRAPGSRASPSTPGAA